MGQGVLWAFASVLLLGCGGRAAESPAYAEPEAGSGSEQLARTSASRGSRPTSPNRRQEPEPVAPATGGEIASSLPQLVFVNDEQLGKPELRELEARLGQPPESGRYWYDATSGLWGLIGHGAGGLTKAGLPAGPLAMSASAGATGVLVNGRELTSTELRIITTLLGWEASNLEPYAGRYVLDEHGELYGPTNRYLGNLVRAAAQTKGANVANPASCAWLRLGSHADALGRGVTVACD